uniref:Cytochrome c n=1 Tax=Geobacter metallireducens TaxID=28232 RepID=A0A831UJV7_GEOME
MKFRTFTSTEILTLAIAIAAYGVICMTGTAIGSTGTAGFTMERGQALSEASSAGKGAKEETLESGTDYPLPPPARKPAKKTVAQRSIPVDGASLYYTSNCAGCHGTMSNMRGATAEMIQTAIDSNVGGMGFHVSLSPEEVHAIADALK